MLEYHIFEFWRDFTPKDNYFTTSLEIKDIPFSSYVFEDVSKSFSN